MIRPTKGATRQARKDEERERDKSPFCNLCGKDVAWSGRAAVCVTCGAVVCVSCLSDRDDTDQCICCEKEGR